MKMDKDTIVDMRLRLRGDSGLMHSAFYGDEPRRQELFESIFVIDDDDPSDVMTDIGFDSLEELIDLIEAVNKVNRGEHRKDGRAPMRPLLMSIALSVERGSVSAFIEIGKEKYGELNIKVNEMDSAIADAALKAIDILKGALR